MLLDGPQRPHNPVYSLLLQITTKKKLCNSIVNWLYAENDVGPRYQQGGLE